MISSVIADFTSKLLRARREFLWVAIGQVTALAGAFVGIKVLTNALGAEEYGRLSLGLTLAGIVNLFVYGPLSQWVLRFFSIHRERHELGPYFLAIRKVYALATAGVGAITLLAAMILWRFIGSEWIILLICASLFAVVAGANNVFVALQSAVRDRKVVALHQGADAWLRPMLAVALLYVFSNSGYVALLGFFLGTFLITLSQQASAKQSEAIADHLRHREVSQDSWERMRGEFLEYVSPFAFFAFFGAISLYADRWILQGVFGAKEVGIYTAMYQIANAPMMLLVGVVSQLVTPVIFDRAGTMTTGVQALRSKEVVHQTVGSTAIVMACLILAAYWFGEPLIAFLTAPGFTEHHTTLWVLVLALSLFNIAQLLSLRGFSSRQTELYIWPKGIQAVSFLAFAYLLVKDRGVMGVALALAMSSLLYVVLVIRVNRRIRLREV